MDSLCLLYETGIQPLLANNNTPWPAPHLSTLQADYSSACSSFCNPARMIPASSFTGWIKASA